MFEVSILEKVGDLDVLYPMIKKMSTQLSVPFLQLLNEVMLSYHDPTYITFISKRDGVITSYFVGYFVTGGTFYFTQGMKNVESNPPENATAVLKFMLSFLKEKGVEKITFHSLPEPSVLGKYGFKVERYLMSMSLTKED